MPFWPGFWPFRAGAPAGPAFAFAGRLLLVACCAAAAPAAPPFGLAGVWVMTLIDALMATPFPSSVRFTGFWSPKFMQPRFVNDALSLAARNVNRLLPVAGTGDAPLSRLARWSLMNLLCTFSMFAQ